MALGRPASNLMLGRDAPIGSLRGKFHDRNGIRVMPTFHPAYLLREPDLVVLGQEVMATDVFEVQTYEVFVVAVFTASPHLPRARRPAR